MYLFGFIHLVPLCFFLINLSLKKLQNIYLYMKENKEYSEAPFEQEGLVALVQDTAFILKA